MAKLKEMETKKADAFQERIGKILVYIMENRKRLYMGLGAVLVIILIVAGWYFYRLDYEKNAGKIYTAAFTFYHFAPPGPGESNALRSIGMFRDVVEKYPGSRSASQSLFSLGNIYYRMNDYDRAIQSYRDYLGESGGKDDLAAFAYSGMGYCYEAKGDTARALAAYENSAKNTLGAAFSGMAYGNIARIYQQMKDNKKALEYYRKAVDEKNDPLMESMFRRKIAELDS